MSLIRIPRRILMTTPTAGEVFEDAVALSAALSQRGIEVLLATMGSPLTDVQVEILQSIDRLKIFESRFELEWMDDAWGDVDPAGDWLLELENATRPDIVHLNDCAHGALPWRAPCVVVAHASLFAPLPGAQGQPARPPRQEYERRLRRGLQHAALVVAPSATMLLWLSENYGQIEKSRVIYNGRSAESADRRYSPSRMASEYLMAYAHVMSAANASLTKEKSAHL